MPEVEPGPWHTESEIWDTLITNDVAWPGRATMEVKRANKWDDKKAQGSHGGERGFKGVDLAKIKIKVEYCTVAEHEEILAKCLPIVEQDPTKKKPDAVQVQHAVATARKVSAFTVDTIDGPKEIRRGVWGYDIDASEHKAPSTKNATGKAGGKGKAGLCQHLKAQHAEQKAAYSAIAGQMPIAIALANQTGNTEPVQLLNVKAENVIKALRSIEAAFDAAGCNDSPPSGKVTASPDP